MGDKQIHKLDDIGQTETELSFQKPFSAHILVFSGDSIIQMWWKIFYVNYII